MAIIFSKTFNLEQGTFEISLNKGELKASLIGGKQIELNGMCHYDKTSPDLSQRLITVLNQSQFELAHNTLKITPQYNPENTKLPQYLTKLLARLYLNDPTLTVTDSAAMDIGDNGAAAIASILNTGTTLNKLDLRGNLISDNEAAAIASVLNTNKTVTILLLSYNNISDCGAVEIASTLLKNKTLTTLDLSHNQISGSGAAAITSALLKNKTLTTLDLRENLIGKEQSLNLKQLAKRKTTDYKNKAYTFTLNT